MISFSWHNCMVKFCCGYVCMMLLDITCVMPYPCDTRLACTCRFTTFAAGNYAIRRICEV